MSPPCRPGAAKKLIKGLNINIMNLFYFLTPKAEVAYLYDDFTLRQALEKMEYHRYSSIPILNRAGEYVGSVTEGDLLWFIKNNAGLDLSSAEECAADVHSPQARLCVRIH